MCALALHGDVFSSTKLVNTSSVNIVLDFKKEAKPRLTTAIFCLAVRKEMKKKGMVTLPQKLIKNPTPKKQADS